MDQQQIKIEETVEDKPPILKSWNSLYALVFINLVVLVVLFYLFTEYFS